MKIDLNKGGKSKDEGGREYFKMIIANNDSFEKDIVY